MATLSEIALGIATVLQSAAEPEPFPVTLRGQSLEDGAFLLKAIIRECRDADIHLQKVEADPELWRHMRDHSSSDFASYMDVPIQNAADLHAELRFFRRS